MLPSLIDRFPGLRRLGNLRSPRTIPFIPQTAGTDCGPACVAMVLGYFGKHVELEEVRRASGLTRDGVSAKALIHAGRLFGLRARAARIEPEDLAFLDRGTVLHWGFTHYVLFDRLKGDRVRIVDPALGYRWVSMTTVREKLTGVVVCFEPTDLFTPRKAAASRIFRYLRGVLADRGLWAGIVVASLMLQLLSLVLPLLSGSIIDTVIPRSDYSLLGVLAGGFLCIGACYLATILVRGNMLVALTTKLDVRLTCEFLEHLTRLSYSFFQRRSHGDLVNRMSASSVVREILTASVLAALLDGPLLVIQLSFLLFVTPSLGLLILGLAVAELGVVWAFRRRQAHLMAQTLSEQAKLSDYQIGMLSGMETIKAMGLEPNALEAWSHVYVDWQNVVAHRARVSATSDALVGSMQLLWPSLVLGAGTLRVLSGDMSLGHMIAIYGVAAGFLSRVGALVKTAGQLQYLGSYLHRLDDIFSSPPEEDPLRVRPAVRLTGAIELQQVSFRYGPESPLVLDNVSFRVGPGQLVGLVGRSGSGKSTLAKLILGLYRPTAGRILYDGRDLADLNLQSVRNQIGLVPQSPHIFAGTVRANVALCDPGVELQKICRAAARACIHEDILAMPLGYETPVSDGGSSLSGGQRQRIALARALLREPVILVLDEATSALDAVTEKSVQAQLSDLECTRLLIAHRLSTVMGADTILVLDQGRVVEDGDHDSLFKRGGHYSRLVKDQMGTAA
jgi:ATP-binding cassette, subfamily B, bacterial